MKVRRRLAAAIFLAMIELAVTALPVTACICLKPPPPRKALKQAKAVLVGRVVDVVVEKNQPTAVLEPLVVWKGVEFGAKAVRVEAPLFEGCTFVFNIGETYLVYAYDGPEDFELSAPLVTNACTRTTKVSAAKNDLRRLPAPKWKRYESEGLRGDVGADPQ